MDGLFQLKLFISFAIEDKLWANQVINFLQDYGFSIQIECLTNEHLFGNTYSSLDENKQYVHVIILSHDYLKHEKRLQSFCKVDALEQKNSESLGKLLNSKPSICIHIDQSKYPNYIDQLKSVRLLKWEPGNELLFWKRFGKLSKALKQKILIRNSLNKDVENNNIKKETLQETENSDSDEENVADVSKDYNYENYNKVYPHLLSNSFTAEDTDLSKSDIEDLTMKVEEIETMLSIDLSTGQTTENPVVEFPKSDLLSHLEQMDVLDLLHSFRHRICEKIEKYDTNISRRKLYRRILKRYDISIKSALNGEKNKIDFVSLPLINMIAKKDEGTHFARCCCCDALFHSERALQIHFENCVKESWKTLIKKK